MILKDIDNILRESEEFREIIEDNNITYKFSGNAVIIINDIAIKDVFKIVIYDDSVKGFEKAGLDEISFCIHTELFDEDCNQYTTLDKINSLKTRKGAKI